MHCKVREVGDEVFETLMRVEAERKAEIEQEGTGCFSDKWSYINSTVRSLILFVPIHTYVCSFF